MTTIRKFTAAIIVLSGALGAVTPVSVAQWSVLAVPTALYVAEDGIVVFGPFGNPGSCGNTNFFAYPTNTSEPGMKDNQLLAMLTTAIVSQTQMRFFMDGCVLMPAISAHTIPKITRTATQFGVP